MATSERIFTNFSEDDMSVSINTGEAEEGFDCPIKLYDIEDDILTSLSPSGARAAARYLLEAADAVDGIRKTNNV